MEMGQRGCGTVTKIILVVLVIAATLTECIVMRKSREYDAADNIAGLERCEEKQKNVRIKSML